MKESITLSFDRYRDKDGNRTCAYDFRTGDVCIFHRTARFGIEDVCGYVNRENGDLKRRNGYMDTLIPVKNCPLWKNVL